MSPFLVWELRREDVHRVINKHSSRSTALWANVGQTCKVHVSQEGNGGASATTAGLSASNSSPQCAKKVMEKGSICGHLHLSTCQTTVSGPLCTSRLLWFTFISFLRLEKSPYSSK